MSQSFSLKEIVRNKYAVFTITLVFATLGLLLIANQLPQRFTGLRSFKGFPNFQQQLQGSQTVRSFCANLYGSDWHTFPDTDAVVICDNMELATSDLIKYGLGKDSRNHGLSYIETGPRASVIIYENEDFTGHTYIVHQDSTVWLEKVSFPQSVEDNWNDNAKSVQVVITKNIRLLYTVQGYQTILPSDYCAVLYATNPIQNPDTIAVVACLDPSLESGTIDFSEAFMNDQGFDLKEFNGGTSYVQTGVEVSITLYNGVDCLKDSDESYFIGEGKAVDLSTVSLNNPNDKKATWENVPQSFTITL